MNAPQTRPLIGPGRCTIRAAISQALEASMNALAHIHDCIKADDKASAADTAHDQQLRRARQHLQVVAEKLDAADEAGARRHLRAAFFCIVDAQTHDATEDEHRGVIRRLLDLIAGCLRIRNGLLDRLLIRRNRRRPTSADQLALGMEG